jgi:TetR/AcrR family transcriptional regulator, cholesterol catabolism regulator
MHDIDLRDSLLRTTARLFQEKGYAAVTLRSIAAEAGVTTGSLYYYFSDKEQIVLEILDTGHKRIHEEVKRAIETLPPEAGRAAKIRAGVRAHVAALFEPGSFPAANIRIYAHVPQHLRDAVRPGRRAYERFWTELLSNASPVSSIPAHHLAMFFFGAANWTFEWHRADRESLEKISDDLASLLLGGDQDLSDGTSRQKAARKKTINAIASKLP